MAPQFMGCFKKEVWVPMIGYWILLYFSLKSSTFCHFGVSFLNFFVGSSTTLLFFPSFLSCFLHSFTTSFYLTGCNKSSLLLSCSSAFSTSLTKSTLLVNHLRLKKWNSVFFWRGCGSMDILKIARLDLDILILRTVKNYCFFQRPLTWERLKVKS